MKREDSCTESLDYHLQKVKDAERRDEVFLLVLTVVKIESVVQIRFLRQCAEAFLSRWKL